MVVARGQARASAALYLAAEALQPAIALRSDLGRLLSSRLRSLRAMRPDELERQAPSTPGCLGPAPRAELLHVLMLPDFERADRPDRRVLGNPESRAFAELLIECEEDRTLRGVLVGMLGETDRSGPS